MTGDALREDALRALGPRGDVWARRALTVGRIEEHATGRRWESSHGTVRAMTVHLLVDAETLGRLDTSPFARDALEHALGVAYARRPLESMAELEIAWGRALPSATASYREAAARPAVLDARTLQRATVAYLEAAGLAAASKAADTASVRVGDAAVRFTLASVDRVARNDIDLALRRLLGRRMRVQVRC
jgi:hypothetical protein